MMENGTERPRDTGRFEPGPEERAPATPEYRPCPNCCRLALVTRRSMGLVFYRCELCESVGAVPEE
jgi:hypothetical protein